MSRQKKKPMPEGDYKIGVRIPAEKYELVVKALSMGLAGSEPDLLRKALYEFLERNKVAGQMNIQFSFTLTDETIRMMEELKKPDEDIKDFCIRYLKTKLKLFH